MSSIRVGVCNVAACKIFLLYIAFCCFIVMATSCFITNCPPGGKRSALSDGKMARQCSRCGPAGMGRCFGPEICCSPAFGCIIRPSSNLREDVAVEAGALDLYSVCRTEDLHPHPCRLPGKACGGDAFEGGRCAVNGLCCSTDRCVLDESCDDVTDIRTSKESSDWVRAFIHNRPPYDIQMNAASK